VIDPATCNRAAVVAAVRSAFERYEAALVANDVAALNGFFLPSDDTVRYGLAEENYGFESIAAYRRAAAAVHPERRLRRTVISTFGEDLACVCAEFTDPSNAQLGRQTQTWVRTAQGWRIALAHVSLSTAAR
jgi:Protein of unknown function (DUF3225)